MARWPVTVRSGGRSACWSNERATCASMRPVGTVKRSATGTYSMYLGMERSVKSMSNDVSRLSLKGLVRPLSASGVPLTLASKEGCT